MTNPEMNAGKMKTMNSVEIYEVTKSFTKTIIKKGENIKAVTITRKIPFPTVVL